MYNIVAMKHIDNLESIIRHNTVNALWILWTDTRVVKSTCENNVQRPVEIYQHRWNLGLHGLPKDKHENIQKLTLLIVQEKRPRRTIIRFSNRGSKLKDHRGSHQVDKALREQLCPLIDGSKAHVAV